MKKILFTMMAVLLFFPSAAYAASKEQIFRMIEQAQVEYCIDDAGSIDIIRSGGKIYALYHTYASFNPDYKENGFQPCSGGSGTYISRLAELVEVEGRLRVSDTDLFRKLKEGNHMINTRFIDSTGMSVSNGIWSFRNAEFGIDPKTGYEDPNCCAGDLYLNQIRLSDMKVISRKFIGRSH